MVFRFFIVVLFLVSVSIFAKNKCTVKNYSLYSYYTNISFVQPNQQKYQLISFDYTPQNIDTLVRPLSHVESGNPFYKIEYLFDFLSPDILRRMSLFTNRYRCNRSVLSSDTLLFARYVTQSVSLMSYLLPLYFYDPRNSNENTKYLLASTLLSFALFPTAFLWGTSIMEMSVSNGYGPMIYIFGLLGTITGFSIPLLLNKNGSISEQLYSNVPLTCGFLGCLSGSFFTFLLPEKQFTYQQAVLVFSSSFTGMVTGVACAKLKKEHYDRNATTGILLGGWSGLLFGLFLKRMLNEQTYFINGNLSMQLSLPVITNIPLLTISYQLPKMKHLTVRLFQLNMNY